ncbi:MAG: 2-oxoacid:acceptor oxidoreductase family protein [Thermoplasmata archaeon]|nr:2-oxoacid:acceptor oxidoreductase family protein [Thermoplasmata archaeon]
MNNEFNMIIAGLGGQGVITSGHILASAAQKEGLNVRTFGNYGMAQRGGAVHLHLRIGDVSSPKVVEGGCNLLVAMELTEGVRNGHYMRPEGTMIVNRKLVMPSGTGKSKVDVKEMEGFLEKVFENLFVMDLDEVLEAGHRRGLNMALLGAGFATGLIPISVEGMKEAIASYSPKRKEANLNAFELGYGVFEKLKKGR